MTRITAFFAAASCLLFAALSIHLSMGADAPSFADTASALVRFEAENYDQSVILYQRLPRAMIAIYVGAITAVSGAILQGLVRNPLASPSTLGINSGATLATIAGAFIFNLDMKAQGIAALAGAVLGFLSCAGVARLAGRRNDPRGLSLILSGALVSMLLVATTNAIMLSDPARRADFLGWASGNINHVYIERLQAFWWIGLLSLGVAAILAKPLTLILLGHEKAESAGVNVNAVSRIGLAAAILGAGSAVAICGPIGFVGLVVPHLVRPLTGTDFRRLLPGCILAGATICLLADFAAREALRPYVLHTGLVMDLMGGIAFVVIVRRFYLAPSSRERT